MDIGGGDVSILDSEKYPIGYTVYLIWTEREASCVRPKNSHQLFFWQQKKNKGAIKQIYVNYPTRKNSQHASQF
ncbi:MAG: hypothetical protein D3908_01885 [Candidatus Electrothrix sp. AUS4]|nr:hypothetical protein [Candidatus Electrothrix sp. AUS4]